MARYVKTTLGSNYASKQQIDINLDDIKTAIDDTLSRKGDSPNAMEADLDMNSNRVLNLLDGVSPGEPITVRQFTEQSVSTKTTQTLKQKHTATAGQTVFGTPTYVIGSNNLSVYVNGVRQDAAAYSETTTTSVTLSEGVETGDIVEVLVNELQESVDQVGAASVTYDGSTVDEYLDKYKHHDTIALAKANTALNVGDRVKTWGYTTAGDGGGAEYLVVAGGTGTDDGGSYHDMSNGNQLELIDEHEDVIARQFGVKADGSSDDYTAIQSAINYADNAIGGSTGRYVKFPTGVSLISQKIIQPNRVGLKGPNGRGFEIRPFAGFSDNEMISAENGTSSMFGALIKDMSINANGFNMTQVVRSVAHQETCGLERVVIQFDGTTRYGYYYEQGYGGAAYIPMKDIEIFSNSTYVSAAGIKVAQISVVGGFLLSVDGATITGSATNPIPAGIVMDNDSLYAKGVHVEYCNSAVTLSGVGSASIESLTGSSNQVTDLVSLEAGFTGRLSLRNIIPNGATGQILKNNITGYHIAASEGMLPNYNFELSGFSAYHSADQTDITGSGTETTAIFDTEIFDRRGEYNNATGVFTAKRQGKYLLSTCLKFNPTLSVTTCIIKIITSNRTYVIYRGDTDSLRDGSSTVTLNGCVIADMDVNDTAKVNIICSGLAGDTIDILANESFFMGHWLER